MIIENDYGQVDLDYDCFYEGKKISICISGGIDSSLLLYLYSNFFKIKNIEYDLITYHDTNRPWIKETALKIAELFPGHVYHRFPQYDSNITPLSQARINIISDLHESGLADVVITGTSKNPPKEISLGVVSEEERSEIQRIENPVETLNILRPFNVDKRWILKEYENNNLLETLLPLTVSCTSKIKTPCGKCFWCKEREWALSNI